MGRIRSSSLVARANGGFGNPALLICLVSLLSFFILALAIPYTVCSALADTSFSHHVSLNQVPGLPAQIELHTDDLHVERARALVTVDDRLLIIPLRSLGSGNYRGIFPSPKEKVTYQFQLVTEGNKARLTRTFRTAQSCGLMDVPSGPPSKAILMKQASALDESVELLTYLARMMEEGGSGK